MKLNLAILKSLQFTMVLVIVCFACKVSAQEKEDSILILPASFKSGYVDEFQHVILDSAQDYVQSNSRDILKLNSFENFQNNLQDKDTYSERIELARGFITLGIDLFQKMDISGASKNLTKGLRHFEELGHGFIAPTEVSTALLYLALARLDDTIDVGQILNIFKEMILIDSKVDLKEGLYPANAVSYFRSAKTDLKKSLVNGAPETIIVGRANELGNSTYIAHFSVIETNTTSHSILLDIFDTQQSRFERRFEIELPSLTRDSLTEAASRLMSQFVSCLEEPSEIPQIPKKSEGKSPWTVDLSFTYVTFLTFPGPADLEPFGHAGAIAGLGYNFTEEFALQVAVEILTSIRDRNGVITKNFQTVRTFAGSDIGFSLGDFKFSIGTFIEAAFFPAVSVCNPVDIRQRSGVCLDVVPEDQFGAFLGANLRPRVSYNITDSVALIAGANSSFYVLPTNAPINFPVSGEFGLKYRF